MLSNQFFSVSDLQKKYAHILQSVEESAKPAFLMKNNKPVAVILSAVEYDRMAESIKALELREAQAAVQSFEDEHKKGTLKPFTTVDDILNSHDENS